MRTLIYFGLLFLVLNLVAGSEELRQRIRARKEERQRRRQERRDSRLGIIPPQSQPQDRPDYDYGTNDYGTSDGQPQGGGPQEVPVGRPVTSRPPQVPVQGRPQQPAPSGGQCPRETQCIVLNECPFVTFLSESDKCSLGPTQSVGICCPTINNGITSRDVPKRPKDAIVFPEVTSLLPSSFPVITLSDIQQAVKKAVDFLANMDSTENIIRQNQLFAKPKTRESTHQGFFGNNSQSIKLDRDGTKMVQTASQIAGKFKLNGAQADLAFKSLSLANSVFRDECPPRSRCRPSKYRTPDGSCNNERNTDWGKSFTAFNRIAFPAYDDGIDTPRTSAKSGRPLPNARLVSFTVSPDRSNENKFLTMMVMQWGQFLDHDITHTATSRASDGSSIRCCGQEFESNPNLRHPACLQISIPRNDPFYVQQGQTCMSFVRSATAPRLNCNLGPREQLNQISAYIDAGMVYGSTEATSRSLREFRGGRLASSQVDGAEFLPQEGTCGIPASKRLKCFKTGDVRANIQVDLIALHGVWLRQHNQLAGQLQQLNPRWDDETLYQETRRIIAAQIQHITYNEFLPVLLGKQVMESFGLSIVGTGASNSYDARVDSGIISAFATAAYRLHSLIPKTIPFVDNEGSTAAEIDLSETSNNPSVVYEKDAFSKLVNGLTNADLQAHDRFFTNQISNHLFRPFGAAFGMDLVALNIQRGRDHGLPGYNTWRKVCGLGQFRRFDEMSKAMRPESVQAIQSVYEHVDDIDLFVGGVSEIPLDGALVGPTFACIIGEQFRRIKVGDRFWYENANMAHSLTNAQMQEIKKTSLARVLCDNSVSSESMQRFAFIQPVGDWNKKVNCKSDAIPKLDIRKWQR